MKWLVTGGCGFIGSSLIRKILLEKPEDRILILDNLSVGEKEVLEAIAEVSVIKSAATEYSSPVALIVGDIRNDSVCLDAAKGADCVVHLAANTGVGPSVQDPRLDLETNVLGTFNVLEACRKSNVAKFVFASSGAPAGVVDPPIHEEMAPHPASPYGASKLAGEGYCSAYFHSFGLQTIALRFGNVYGPGSGKKSSVVAKFIKNAMSGVTCEIYGDGTQTRDFIYVEDLVEAILLASEYQGGGEIFQIASGMEVNINELVSLLQSIMLDSANIEMKVDQVESRIGDVARNYSDTSKALNLLGWSSKHSLHDGLKKTVQEFI